jgi:hypothetical protein
MAVAQGYGKTVTSGSVFAYDVADTRNSYIGEPTTNLVSNKIAGDYGNAPGSSTTTISPDGTNNATVPVPDATADRYQQTIAGGTYSTGTQLTYSWHYKQLTTHAGTLPNELGGLYISALINCTLVGSKTKIADLPNGWTRWQATFQISDGSLQSIIRLYFGSVIGIGGSSAAYYGHQLELKSHATPFTTGTRSATQGLLPLVGNSTLDLSNVSFDSNAQMTFDGTDDILDTGLFSGRNPSTDPFTVEAILKSDTLSGARMWIDASTSGTDRRFFSSLDDGGGNPLGIQGSTWADTTPASTAYTHQTIVMDGNTARSYRNGVATYTKAYTSYTLPGSLNIGGRAGFPWLGQIPVAKIYNRALTAAEVDQNYKHYKTRFNLS